MQINGPGPTYRVHGPESLGGPHRTAAKPNGARPADEVEISPAAQEAARLAETAAARAADQPVRADLVAKLRSEIASGSYETPEKLDAALDRMLDEIG